MRNHRILSRLVAFTIVFAIAFFTISLAVAWYFFNQQLTKQKITDYSWQFDTVQEGSLRFNHVNFIYNNQLDIHIENIHFSANDSTEKNFSFPFISASKIKIGHIKISVLDNAQHHIKELSDTSLQKNIETLKAQLQNIKNQPEWLAFLPQQIEVLSLIFQTPCSVGACSVQGSANLNINNTNTETQAKAHFKLHDKEVVNPYIENQLLQQRQELLHSILVSIQR